MTSSRETQATSGLSVEPAPRVHPSSAIFELADRVVEGTYAADPTIATLMGVTAYDARLTDFSPEAADERAADIRGWLGELGALPVTSEDDRLAAAVMRDRLEAKVAQHEAGQHLRDCNDFGLVQATRDTFTLMANVTDADWEVIAQRLEAVPASLASLQLAFEAGIAAGLLTARRQISGTARAAAIVGGIEADGDAEPADWFAAFTGAYGGADESLKRRLATASHVASTAFADQAVWMREEFLPTGTDIDAVGPDRYRLQARFWCGAELDLVETYAWGWQELGRITTRMIECAQRLYGGMTPSQAKARLYADPKYTTASAEFAQSWLQQLTDETVASFDGTYFDIPEIMRTCEVKLGPAGSAPSPYYTPPSEDFTRPGRTWLPTGEESAFPLWLHRSTWFHEAVPGHHLQVGYTMLQREHISRFQRLEYVSGHAEGWALYAERLMDELGYFEDPAYELGYLSEQGLRAARIVVDIGLHLNLTIPSDVDAALLDGLQGDPRGAEWAPDLARVFLAERSGLSETFAAREIDRYLGVPGQAIAYKVGERTWLQAREDARASAGAAFDLKAWHMRALAMGTVPLDVLRAELARTA